MTFQEAMNEVTRLQNNQAKTVDVLIKHYYVNQKEFIEQIDYRTPLGLLLALCRNLEADNLRLNKFISECNEKWKPKKEEKK